MLNELLQIIICTFERGLIFSVAIIGMFLTSRILKRDDLTIEGSFGLGGALTALLLVNGIHPLLGIVISLCAGACAGLITALLHTKLSFNHLISGIIVSTALFSINLKLAGTNIPLGRVKTIFSMLPPAWLWLVLLPIVLCIVGSCTWFLQTETGFLLRASGTNGSFVTTLAKSPKRFIMLGFMLANACNALAGSLFVQYVGFFSIWSNVGILIIVLAGLILADIIPSKWLLNIIAGSVLYQAIITTTFELQIDQDWNKLITALLIISMMTLHTKNRNNND